MSIVDIVLWHPGDRVRPVVAATHVETASVLQSVFSLMARHRLAIASRVLVTFAADGATWQAYQVACPLGPVSLLDPLAPRIPRPYDVALWRHDWPGELPLVDPCVLAASPLLAALSVMTSHKLDYVHRIAVGCPDRSVWRRSRLALHPDDQVSQTPGDLAAQEEVSCE